LTLPEPYYHNPDCGITIYHGDCRDILPYLEKVDLVLTDPPYGMKYRSNYYKWGNPHNAIQGDSEFPMSIIFDCMSNTTRAVLSFCRWSNLKELSPPPKSFIVWIKNNWTAGDLYHEYGRQWEGIAFWPLRNHKFAGSRPSDIIYESRVPPTKLLHPTEKPIRLIKNILQHHIGDLILDPFMGSGTTLVAAKKLGRRAIGIEIEEKYCEIAVERLRQGVFNFAGTEQI